MGLSDHASQAAQFQSSRRHVATLLQVLAKAATFVGWTDLILCGLKSPKDRRKQPENNHLKASAYLAYLAQLAQLAYLASSKFVHSKDFIEVHSLDQFRHQKLQPFRSKHSLNSFSGGLWANLRRVEPASAWEIPSTEISKKANRNKPKQTKFQGPPLCAPSTFCSFPLWGLGCVFDIQLRQTLLPSILHRNTRVEGTTAAHKFLFRIILGPEVWCPTTQQWKAKQSKAHVKHGTSIDGLSFCVQTLQHRSNCSRASFWPHAPSIPSIPSMWLILTEWRLDLWWWVKLHLPHVPALH